MEDVVLYWGRVEEVEGERRGWDTLDLLEGVLTGGGEGWIIDDILK